MLVNVLKFCSDLVTTFTQAINIISSFQWFVFKSFMLFEITYPIFIINTGTTLKGFHQYYHSIENGFIVWCIQKSTKFQIFASSYEYTLRHFILHTNFNNKGFSRLLQFYQSVCCVKCVHTRHMYNLLKQYTGKERVWAKLKALEFALTVEKTTSLVGYASYIFCGSYQQKTILYKAVVL